VVSGRGSHARLEWSNGLRGGTCVVEGDYARDAATGRRTFAGRLTGCGSPGAPRLVAEVDQQAGARVATARTARPGTAAGGSPVQDPPAATSGGAEPTRPVGAIRPRLAARMPKGARGPGGAVTAACPTQVGFQGVIEAPAATEIRYTFVRDDGARSKEQVVFMTAPGEIAVSTSRQITDSGSGWMVLRVTSPVQVDSERVEFEVSCRSNGPAAASTVASGAAARGPVEPWPGMRCRSIDPATLAVAPFKGETGLVEPGGVLALGGFGSSADAAARTLEVLRFYGSDRACSVGDPRRPVVHLFTRGEKMATGAMEGESCDPPFGVKTLAVREAKGQWVVETSEKVLLGYFPQEAGARRYASELFQLGARHLCSVGGSKASLRYLRR
jgi:hypothetical protein